MNAKLTAITFTRQYYDVLQPVLNRLQILKQTTSPEIWLTMVHHQRQEIIHNAHRHLGIALSLRKEMQRTIENVFHDFVRRELPVQLIATQNNSTNPQDFVMQESAVSMAY